MTKRIENKGLIITTIIFFLTINTSYYWEGKLGLFSFPAFLVLVVIYFGLTFALIRQIYFTIEERFVNKTRLLPIGLLVAVLILTFIKPFGFVRFDKLESENILIAEIEGAANCMTTLKLKDDCTFTERTVCFGVTEIKGKYRKKKDTIYFENVELGRHRNEFCKFAVLRHSKSQNDGKHFDLQTYKSLADTVGHKLSITKIELNKLNGKDPDQAHILQ